MRNCLARRAGHDHDPQLEERSCYKAADLNGVRIPGSMT
jgi:hypothetical protein